ncbi:MAG: hypothetical protein LBT62_08520 [Deltaproteobacteria bacterium]|nr:hypothetical protein [Deltaproteobacteria bacterium]
MAKNSTKAPQIIDDWDSIPLDPTADDWDDPQPVKASLETRHAKDGPAPKVRQGSVKAGIPGPDDDSVDLADDDEFAFEKDLDLDEALKEQLEQNGDLWLDGRNETDGENERRPKDKASLNERNTTKQAQQRWDGPERNFSGLEPKPPNLSDVPEIEEIEVDDIEPGDAQGEEIMESSEDLHERSGGLHERSEGIHERSEDLHDQSEDLHQQSKRLRERSDGFVQSGDDFEERSDGFVQPADDFEESADGFEESADGSLEQSDDFEESADGSQEPTDSFDELDDVISRRPGGQKTTDQEFGERLKPNPEPMDALSVRSNTNFEDEEDFSDSPQPKARQDNLGSVDDLDEEPAIFDQNAAPSVAAPSRSSSRSASDQDEESQGDQVEDFGEKIKDSTDYDKAQLDSENLLGQPVAKPPDATQSGISPRAQRSNRSSVNNNEGDQGRADFLKSLLDGDSPVPQKVELDLDGIFDQAKKEIEELSPDATHQPVTAPLPEPPDEEEVIDPNPFLTETPTVKKVPKYKMAILAGTLVLVLLGLGWASYQIFFKTEPTAPQMNLEPDPLTVAAPVPGELALKRFLIDMTQDDQSVVVELEIVLHYHDAADTLLIEREQTVIRDYIFRITKAAGPAILNNADLKKKLQADLLTTLNNISSLKSDSSEPKLTYVQISLLRKR